MGDIEYCLNGIPHDTGNHRRVTPLCRRTVCLSGLSLTGLTHALHRHSAYAHSE